jgi:hypothetical protein
MAKPARPATHDQRRAGRGKAECGWNTIMCNHIAGGNNLAEFGDLTFQALYTESGE